ncbi:MAG: hypothetical protein V1860_00935 [bacterium]
MKIGFCNGIFYRIKNISGRFSKGIITGVKSEMRLNCILLMKGWPIIY